MNRYRSVLIAMMGFLFLSVSGSLFAVSGYGNADYLRTLNRSASVGTIDSMFFNPAGTVRLADGIYIQGGVDFPIVSRTLPTLTPSYKTMGLGLPGASLGFVYKRAGSSVFVTLMPSLSSGLNLSGLVLPAPRPPAQISVIDADYHFKNLTYELTAGGAFSFNDVLAMSFGARLIADMSLTGIDYTFTATQTAYKEKYSRNLMTFGAAMHAGLLVTPIPWFAFALNLHSGGFGVGVNSVKSVILPTAANAPALSPSSQEKRPQSGGFVVNGLPARLDLGFLFNVNDVMDLQLTGQARVQLFKNTPTGVSFDLFSVTFGYSAGLGMDFKISKNFIWGLGVMYSDDTIKDTAYYSTVDSLNVVKLRSITVGTGFSFNMGDMFGLSLGAAYPLYFTTKNGFSVSTLTMPGGGKAKISDILIALGVNVKMDGLY